MIWLAVAIGGALGSAARHGVNDLFGHVLGRPGFYSTAAVNLSGSFIIGLLAGLIAGGRLHETPIMRAFVFVGILGGFTTFSSFMLDTFTLAEGHHGLLAFANVAGQVVAGYALAYVGFKIGV
jgi:fluoride exporter